MQKKQTIIIISAAVTVTLWIFLAVMNMIFTDNKLFLDALIFNVKTRDLILRLVFALFFGIFSVITLYIFSKRKAAEKTTLTLYDISKAVHSVNNLNELYPLVHQTLGTILDTTNFFIALFNRTSDTISFPYFADEEDDEFSIISASNSGSLTARVINSGKSLFLTRKEIIKWLESLGLSALGTIPKIWMGVPLKIRDDIIGAVALQSYHDSKLYSKDDIKLLETISEQIAVSIQRKRDSDALIESEEKYKAVLLQSTDSIYLMDIESSKIVESNDAFCKILGYSPEEANHLTVFDFIHSDKEKIINNIQHVLDNGYIAISERQYKRKDGVIVDVDVKSNVINYHGKKAICTVTRDITDRKKAEEQIRMLNKDLEKRVIERTRELQMARDDLAELLKKEKDLGELKTRFINMISHEYRTPMTVINMSSSLIEECLKHDKAEHIPEQLTKIANSIESMSRLIDSVIAFSKLEEGSISAFLSPFNIIELFNDIISETDPENHNIILIENLSTETLLSDRKLLKQSLAYLVHNAIKYSPEGSEVKVIVNENKDSILINIADNGIGIPEEDRHFLFEPFYKNKESVGLQEGTGLGLAIVKKYIEILSGSISFETEVNKGTTFYIILAKERKNSEIV